ncbi:MAG: RNA polymerase sigma factor [Desulfobacterales bacterium]|nr:MAG: RNA polymerase sigma factor [Desulfobacterales bacterium]
MAHANDKTPTSAITELVHKAREGNRYAFEQLVVRFQGEIYRMIYYRTRSRLDAEDLTQDVFMKAFDHISHIKEADRFRSWLFSIAVNQVRDFQRKQRFRSLFKVSDDRADFERTEDQGREEPQALDHLLQKDFWRQVRLILDKLSRMEREVFLLRFFDHLNIKEISKVLKKNESTVKTHLYRALAKFKQESRLRQWLQEVSS